jgi:DNA-binding PadR family transcriptional regulator
VALKSRRGRGNQEHFARIPVSVLQSPAVMTLNHAAFKVLVILASQWRGGNNGTLALTESFARKYGLAGRDTLYRSLRDLEQRGLIVRTRQGMKSKRLFTLWALGWESITHRDGKPLDVPEPKNNKRWLDWRPATAGALGTNAERMAAEIQTDFRESTVPTIGSDGTVSVPMLPDRSPASVPTIGNTSRVLPEARSATGSDPTYIQQLDVEGRQLGTRLIRCR